MNRATVSQTDLDATPAHGIAVAERKTGVSQHLLRAWERRYAAVQPVRDEAGQRLYSDRDLERIRLLKAVCAGGRRIGQVATLDSPALHDLATGDARDTISLETASREAGAVGVAGSDAGRYLDAALEHVSRFSGDSAHRVLMRAVVALGPRAFIEDVATPLLRKVGADWELGLIRPAEEHAISVAMRRVLAWLMDALPARSRAPLIVFGTTPNQRHEFGAMLAAAATAASDYRVLYLGGDLPGDEIAHAAVIAGADAVGISVVGAVDVTAFARDMELLRQTLPDSIPIVLGGAAAVEVAHVVANSGAVIIHNLAEWDAWLSSTLPVFTGALL